jgi:hypothetical protein
VLSARLDEDGAVRAALLRQNLLSRAAPDRAAGHAFERFEIELRLACERALEQRQDALVVGDPLTDLGRAEASGDLVRDQRIELCVLRFLEPVVVEQAFEQRIERGLGLDALDVVLLRHPLDVEDDQRDTELRVLENRVRDVARGTDHLTGRVEAFAKQLREALEELDVLRLFTRKLEQRSDFRVVAVDLAARVVEQERQDELLDQSEERQVAVTPNLIEQQALGRPERAKLGGGSQAVGEKRGRKVERLAFPEHVFQTP